MAREIGVSFIPVREAIAQLAIEGVVRHEAGVGTYAARVEDDELRELYDLRTALERHALTSAGPRLEPADLARMQFANEAMRALTVRREGVEEVVSAEARRAEWEAQDASFHGVIALRAGNVRLRTTLEGIRVRIRLYAVGLGVESRELRLAVCRQHDELIEALTGGRIVDACARLVTHLEAEVQSLLARRSALELA